MGNFEDFDLNITYDEKSGSGSSGLTGNLACYTVTVSLEVCDNLSEAIDCLSEEIDCSGGEWSKCNACGSSAVNVARC